MQVDKKHDIVYVVTKFGFIQLYDLETGICLFIHRLSTDTVFTTAEWEVNDGLIGINRKGQVHTVKFLFYIYWFFLIGFISLCR